MAPPLPLPQDAAVGQLTQWLTEWSLLYPFGGDGLIRPVVRPRGGCLTPGELKIVMEWKIGDRFKQAAFDQIDAYEAANAGEISGKTALAMVATTDAQALQELRGLPQMKTRFVAAVGSAILMCLDPERWTVMDVNANAALVCLRDTLRSQAGNPNSPLHDLAVELSTFTPRRTTNGYEARTVDWPTYMSICRTIARTTMLSLRTVDRALQQARTWC
jgi:hypothetical protein